MYTARLMDGMDKDNKMKKYEIILEAVALSEPVKLEIEATSLNDAIDKAEGKANQWTDRLTVVWKAQCAEEA